MAQAGPPTNDRKRVKVYELRNNDWYDRGTGFCVGQMVNDEARIYVQSEEEPNRTLLETKIQKDDGYQKQQDTLIVWTEPNGVDMALSFQEAEGCAAIWEFVSDTQQRFTGLGPDDNLEDDVLEGFNPMLLPTPELSNLHEIEAMMRTANTSPGGRDALAKFIMNKEVDYISKLVPLVEMAEDLESLPDLHRLCNIMKTLILLNDTAIIEFVVTDEVILGVVGALEYDPDFPSHKANHRQYLSDESKFKEVVPIEDAEIKKKIHYTYRLQYLKDVVLARILDDPTFSVLNSLIFFHQVDIVQHLQSSQAFLSELFGIFSDDATDQPRKKDAVLFIQQCCAVAKNLQAQSRASLYQNFIHGGLFTVITFALRHHDASVRVAGTDVLVALIDHDPLMMRSHIFKAINEKAKPLTDTLIELLLVEVDLGVKAQMADAIKVLLDPNANSASVEQMSRTNTEFLAKMRNVSAAQPQAESFIQNFYDESAKKLFQPLKDLEKREDMNNLTVQEISLYSHLVEVLCFFIRQHSFRSKYFILSEGLASRVAQLMSSGEKHLKLTALKYFRTCIGLLDEFHNRQIISNRLFEPILNIVFETMPKDNLLNSACLELFEFIKRENVKAIIVHVVETYRDQLKDINYVPTFQQLILRYDQLQGIQGTESTDTSFITQDGEPNSSANANPLVRHSRTGSLINGGGTRWQGIRDTDADEEAYFDSVQNDDDDEDELSLPSVTSTSSKTMTNGISLHSSASPVKHALVSYPDDDNEDADVDLDQMDVLTASPGTPNQNQHTTTNAANLADVPSSSPESPAISISTTPVKRRREDDEEDELDKLVSTHKRRSSSATLGRSTHNSSPESKIGNGESQLGNGNQTKEQDENGEIGEDDSRGAVREPNQTTGAPLHGHMLRRKSSIKPGKDGGPKKIAISFTVRDKDQSPSGDGE
ncbi:MAG: Platinum sensitivity protein [Bathelium mastoideum]|nr:MAG: Platinum sensitivity protein [Bathelium mastoideum]